MANEFTGSGVTFGFNSVAVPATYTTLAGVTSMEELRRVVAVSDS